MKSDRLNVIIGIVTGILIGFVCGVAYINSSVSDTLTGEEAAGDIFQVLIATPAKMPVVKAPADTQFEEQTHMTGPIYNKPGSLPEDLRVMTPTY